MSEEGGRPRQRGGRRMRRAGKARRRRFLEALALSCNVARAAEHAGTTADAMQRERALDPGFAEEWRVALAAGYDRLEALVLEHGGAAVKLPGDDPDAAEPPPFAFDRAMKLLQAHRAERAAASAPPRASREETVAALMKAVAAVARRGETSLGG